MLYFWCSNSTFINKIMSGVLSIMDFSLYLRLGQTGIVYVRASDSSVVLVLSYSSMLFEYSGETPILYFALSLPYHI